MATKKQSRAHAKRRQEAYDTRLQIRMERRRKRLQVGGFIAVGALVTGGILAGLSTGRGIESTNPHPTFTVTQDIPEPSDAIPDPSLAEARDWTATIQTDQGPIDLVLDGAAAPQAVANFMTLANGGYYDGTRCHRLVTEGIFVLQCGDPTATGTGGPGYSWGPVENDPADQLYRRGTVAMARVGGDEFSMGSQFFIVFGDSTIPSDPIGGFGYTVFGKVTSGLDIVDAVAAAGTTSGQSDGDPATPVILNEVTVQ